jgi:hypothetical protein
MSEMMDALTRAVGEERVGVRISPQNNIDDSESQWLVNHRAWPAEGIAYLQRYRRLYLRQDGCRRLTT